MFTDVLILEHEYDKGFMHIQAMLKEVAGSHEVVSFKISQFFHFLSLFLSSSDMRGKPRICTSFYFTRTKDQIFNKK